MSESKEKDKSIFIPKGFSEFEWEIDGIRCEGEYVNINSLVTRILGKRSVISFTKEDISEMEEFKQNFVKLVGQQGWCIKGEYYTLYFMAIEWLEKKIQTPSQKKKLQAFVSSNDFDKALSQAVKEFLKVNIRIQWDNFLSSIRDAKNSCIVYKEILEEIFEGDKSFIEYTEKEVRDYIKNKIHGKEKRKEG